MAAYIPQTIEVIASSTGGAASDGAGKAVDVQGAVEKWVKLTGTWGGGEVDVEASMDGGTTWLVANSDVDGLTADTGIIEIPQGCTHLRCKTNTNVTSVTCQLITLELGASPPPPPTPSA